MTGKFIIIISMALSRQAYNNLNAQGLLPTIIYNDTNILPKSSRKWHS